MPLPLVGRLFRRERKGRKETARSRPERRGAQRVAVNVAVSLRSFGASGGSVSAPGIVRNSSLTGFGVDVPLHFAAGETLWIRPGSAPEIKAIVRGCRPKGQGFRIGVILIDNERRRGDRFPASGRARIKWAGESGRTLSVAARVRNATEDGVQVETAEPVPERTTVIIIGEGIESAATVRYSIPAPGGYLSGLQLMGARRRGRSGWRGGAAQGVFERSPNVSA